VLDDGVAKPAKHARCLTETLHADAVWRVGVETRQHSVTDTRSKHHVVPNVLGTTLAVRRQVHVETVDRASVADVLYTGHTLLHGHFGIYI